MIPASAAVARRSETAIRPQCAYLQKLSRMASIVQHLVRFDMALLTMGKTFAGRP